MTNIFAVTQEMKFGNSQMFEFHLVLMQRVIEKARTAKKEASHER